MNVDNFFFIERTPCGLANEGDATSVAREIYAMPVLDKDFNTTEHELTIDLKTLEEDFNLSWSN